MLRQIIILKKNDFLYKRYFSNALSDSEIEDLSYKIWQILKRRIEKNTDHFDYFKFRVSYDVDIEKELIFLFITGLVDDYFSTIKPELALFKQEVFDKVNFNQIHDKLTQDQTDIINSIADPLHRKLKPKISIVGFSGVGKTTTKQLIKLDKIPTYHIPTITGDIATIKIGDLFFNLFDFAGQEQFRYLWKSFIKGSDGVLVITDSTLNNIEKSKFFIDLIEKEVPYARSAVIGNKQDLKGAMDIKDIEKELGLITYPMVANRNENRDRMIRILAEVLELSYESTPLIGTLMEKSPLLEQSIKINEAQIEENSLMNTEIKNESIKYEDNVMKKESSYVDQKEISSDKFDTHYSKKKQGLIEEIEKVNFEDRILGIIKVKKNVKIDYIQRFLKIEPDKIIGIIFDLIGKGEITGEFNQDDTEFYLK
ncbi:MAG: GTP-binding protein [Candidatus Lokiarchaeota archaeon]|nr:GTP-binding protein [Candidatus Lokiarchaeota archaeon]